MLVVGALALNEDVARRAPPRVCAIVLGILGWVGAFPGHIARESANLLRDVGFGLAIGAVIASYTLVDSEAMEHARPIAYFALVLAPCALLYPLVGRTRPELQRPHRAHVRGHLGAYLLVLAALRLAPAAPVAAVRETSVVIAAILAAAVLHEPVGARKLAGALAVTAGVALIAYS